MSFTDAAARSAGSGPLEFVVAVHDAEATIGACVRSLLDGQQAMRVTVVADSCRDRTLAVLATIRDSRLRVMSVEHRSRAKSSNAGFRTACADFVCSVDADVRFVEDRFGELLSLMDEYPFLMLTEDPADRSVRTVRLTENDFAPPRNAFIYSRRHLPNLVFAEIYPKAGGEDTDLAIRLVKAGVPIGAVYGGYVHARTEGSMGWRRRLHFHVWNLITYLRHLDVPMCRQRLLGIAHHLLRRVIRSVRQELGVKGDHRG